MIKNPGGLLIALLLTCVASVSAQLPPEILLDQLLLRAERLVETDDLDPAVEAMEEAFAFGADHGLELPPDLRFEHARVSFAVGLLGAARASVTGYLTAAGREGESYEAALALLEDVDRILERRDAPACAPLPEGAACWMELTSHPGCYLWNPAPQATETAAWTGECSAGFAGGPGTVIWTYGDGEQEHEGNRRYGQPHGESVIRDSAGWVEGGPFRFGKRHGAWIERTADGAVLEGPYVDDEENGHWVLRFADGGVQEGPFVDGERNRHWVERFANGTIAEGPYTDGERNGHWVIKFPDGGIQEGPYLGGQRNGHWIDNDVDGGIGEGSYVDGKRNGRWTWTYPDDQIESGPYENGEKHGQWVIQRPDGAIERGAFAAGKRQGRWTREELAPNARICEIEVVNDEAVGEWDCHIRP